MCRWVLLSIPVSQGLQRGRGRRESCEWDGTSPWYQEEPEPGPKPAVREVGSGTGSAGRTPATPRAAGRWITPSGLKASTVFPPPRQIQGIQVALMPEWALAQFAAAGCMPFTGEHTVKPHNFLRNCQNVSSPWVRIIFILYTVMPQHFYI